MENLSPRYISNSPVGKDQFKGQSHHRIASVIASQIREGSSNMIGIDGGWGSGKSNLIKLVNVDLNGNKDESKKDYPVIVYDAWGHISDLQRRSILEEVTSSLIQNFNALPSTWHSKLNELLAKKKAVHAKKVPSLSAPLITLLIGILFVPLINYFIGIVDAGSFWKWMIPLLFAISLSLIIIVERIFSLHKYCQKISLYNIFSEMFMLYQGKISESTTYETLSETEPSSRQFKSWMHDLDKCLPDKIKKVVLVFDNLDRLPAKKVQEFWAAIHSFFSEERFKKLCVIVPFDRMHVVNAFKEENHQQASEYQQSYGDDFINKTFDVVYRVPPIIISDWKYYFETKWHEAFGENCNVPTAITQIYSALTTTITPRDIVSFINEYVSIILTSKDLIPEQYIALFIFGRPFISKDPHKELLSPSYLGSLSFLYQNDTEMPKYLSALFYELPVDDALDVVFTRQCKLALDNNNPNILEELLKHPKIFVGICENAILDIDNVENASLCLNKLNLTDIDKSFIERLWACLYKKIDFDKIEKEGVKEYQNCLLRNVVDQKSKETLAISLVKGYRYAEENRPDEDNYIKGVRLIKELDENLAVKAISPCWNISPELFIRLVERAGNKWHLFAITIQEKKLDEHLASLDIDALKKLEVVRLITEMEIYDSTKLTLYNKSLRDKIASNSADIKPIRIVLERLKEIECPISKAQELIPDNILYQLIDSVNVEDDNFIELTNLVLARGANYGYSNRSNISTILNSPTQHQINDVCSRIENYITYGELLLNANNYSCYPLGIKVVQNLTSKGPGKYSRCNIKKCILNFDKILNAYALTTESLFNYLNYYDCETLSFSKDEYSKFSIELVKTCIVSKNSLASKLREGLEGFIFDINQSHWEKILRDDSAELGIYLNYKPIRCQTLVDAVSSKLKLTITDNKASIQISRFPELIKKMEAANEDLSKLFEPIVDLYMAGYPQTCQLFCEIAPFVFRYAVGYIRSEEKFERFIPSDIMENDAVIDILINNQAELRKCNKPDSFKAKLREMATSGRKKDEKFVNFVKYLGLIKSNKDNKRDN